MVNFLRETEKPCLSSNTGTWLSFWQQISLLELYYDHTTCIKYPLLPIVTIYYTFKYPLTWQIRSYQNSQQDLHHLDRHRRNQKDVWHWEDKDGCSLHFLWHTDLWKRETVKIKLQCQYCVCTYVLLTVYVYFKQLDKWTILHHLSWVHYNNYSGT